MNREALEAYAALHPTPYSSLTPEERERYFGIWPARMTETQTFLRTQIEIHCTLGSLLYPYLMQRGKVFDAAPLPGAYLRGPKGECFGNAMKQVLASGGGLVYVEGYALSSWGLVTQHGWCVTETGQVIDPTWDNPEQGAYLGIPFDEFFWQTEISRTGCWGVLGELPPRHVLSAPVAEQIHPWFRAEIAARPVWPTLAQVLD